jgi:hypothetical protein
MQLSEEQEEEEGRLRDAVWLCCGCRQRDVIAMILGGGSSDYE